MMTAASPRSLEAADFDQSSTTLIRSNSLSASSGTKDGDVPALTHRRMLQHRNSWPTNDVDLPKPPSTSRANRLTSMKEEGSTSSVSEAGDELTSPRNGDQPQRRRSSTSPESEMDGEQSDEDVDGQTPSPARQRHVIKHIDAESPCTYAVAKVWYRRWEEHVGAAKGFVAGQTEAPGPVDMDTHNDECNTYVHEEIWKRLVSWYGVAKTHQLDRKHLYFKDEKNFDVCMLSPFSGIVEHCTKRFNRFEETGYVELQLRRIFGVTSTRRSRLWISEKAAQVPRFRQLLARSRMLNDCIHREKSYILALEVADRTGGGDSWPTGEPGEPKGELTRYAELYGPGWGGLDTWTEEVRRGLSELQRTVSDNVRQATELFLSDARSGLRQLEKLLEDQRKLADSRLKTLQVREKQLCATETSLAERESAVEQGRKQLEADREKLDRAEEEFKQEMTRVDGLQRIQDSKVKLDVGGRIYTTSVQTLRRYPDSLLGMMFSGRHELKSESDGSFFVDRDGAHFRYVLNFMRDGMIDPETLPKDRSTVKELICEAKYYQLGALVEYLENLLRSWMDNGNSKHK